MTVGAVRLIDDRLLISHLLSNEPDTGARIATTSLWYYRACRASVLGAGGQLSGPFTRLDLNHQQAAIRRLLELEEHIELPNPRLTVPVMAQLAEQHTRLNVLSLEAAAAALTLGATVHLSPKAALGVLPQVLDAENIAWQEVEPW